jgi:hypothetical protein
MIFTLSTQSNVKDVLVSVCVLVCRLWLLSWNGLIAILMTLNLIII